MPSNYYRAIATFKGYPGNFEREITQWVFGNPNEWSHDPSMAEDRPHVAEMAWAFDPRPDGMEGLLLFFTLGGAHDWSEASETLDSHRLEWRFEYATYPEGVITQENWDALYAAADSFAERMGEYHEEGTKLLNLEIELVEYSITDIAEYSAEVTDARSN